MDSWPNKETPLTDEQEAELFGDVQEYPELVVENTRLKAELEQRDIHFIRISNVVAQMQERLNARDEELGKVRTWLADMCVVWVQRHGTQSPHINRETFDAITNYLTGHQ